MGFKRPYENVVQNHLNNKTGGYIDHESLVGQKGQGSNTKSTKQISEL